VGWDIQTVGCFGWTIFGPNSTETDRCPPLLDDCPYALLTPIINFIAFFSEAPHFISYFHSSITSLNSDNLRISYTFLIPISIVLFYKKPSMQFNWVWYLNWNFELSSNSDHTSKWKLN
jgi:hypothetical protein